MRILFLIYSLGGGGAERVTTSLANEFVAMGHTVEIAVLNGAVPAQYKLSPGVLLTDLGLAGEPHSALGSVIELIRRILVVRNLLRRSRPTLAIGMMATAATLLGLARIGLPLIAVGSERTFPPASPLPNHWGILREFSYGLLDFVVVQTKTVQRWVEENTRAKQTLIIGNPVIATAQPRKLSMAPYDIRPGASVILAVGRLVGYKGFDRLISAFAMIADQHPQWDLVILGEGELRDALADQGCEAGIADRLKLPGQVDEPETWYALADLFVLPSRFEGMPNALLEAMAHGLPCIAYDIESGTREFVTDGVDAVLVPEEPPEAMAKAMDDLMRDEPRRTALGKEAAIAIKRYDTKVIAGQWLALAKPGRD